MIIFKTKTLELTARGRRKGRAFHLMPALHFYRWSPDYWTAHFCFLFFHLCLRRVEYWHP